MIAAQVVVVASTLALVAGCGFEPVPLDSQPANDKEAQRLAQSVAAAADCRSFDVFNFEDVGDGTIWSFECQRDGALYILGTGSDQKTLELWIGKFRDGPVVVGDFFAVHTGDSRPTSLEGFPGELRGTE